MSVALLPPQFTKLPFTFDVPNDADGVILSVGQADPTSEVVLGTHAPVTGGDGKRAVAWSIRCPAAEAAGIRVSEGVAAQGADDFETLTPGESNRWPDSRPATYYRVVGDGAASKVTGWALVCPA